MCKSIFRRNVYVRSKFSNVRSSHGFFAPAPTLGEHWSQPKTKSLTIICFCDFSILRDHKRNKRRVQIGSALAPTEVHKRLLCSRCSSCPGQRIHPIYELSAECGHYALVIMPWSL